MDINLHSFNGPADNGRVVEMADDIVPAPGIADTIKCSTGLTNFRATFGLVVAGREDALDVNNYCENLCIDAQVWRISGSKYGITIKGESHDICVSGVVHGHGAECDVDLGNWSDQSNGRSKRTTLDLWSADGSPIRIRVLSAEKPTLSKGSGPYKYAFPSPNLPCHGLIVKAFLKLRRLGLFR